MATFQNSYSTLGSSNNIETNYRTELVALRAAQVAGYFTIGSKAYLGDQLIGKRNGGTYGFVIRDAGEVVNALANSGNEKDTVIERKVELSIEPWHINAKTNAVETKTDLDFDKEIAEPDGQKLINGAIKKSIAKDISCSATCFVGEVGKFEPLSLASAHLQSITSEPLYGFVDPDIEAIVTSRGAQFVPVDAPAMYRQGLIGLFHGAQYRSQRFLKQLKISKALADAMEGATFASFASNTLTVTLGTAAASATSVKAGTPFFVEGIVACDFVGDETAKPYAFIATEDVPVAQGATTVAVKVQPVDVAFGGTREASLDDGTAIDWSTFSTDAAVSMPAFGTYAVGLVRANGVFEFETLNEIDVSNADSKKGSVEGLTIFQNKVINLDLMKNHTRFDLFTVSGVVDKRGQSMVLCKLG